MKVTPTLLVVMAKLRFNEPLGFFPDPERKLLMEAAISLMQPSLFTGTQEHLFP